MSQDTFLSGPNVSASDTDRQLALAAAPAPEDSLITMHMARLNQRIQALEERFEEFEQGRGRSRSRSPPLMCFVISSSDRPLFWKLKLLCRYPECSNTFTSDFLEGPAPYEEAVKAGWQEGKKNWKNPSCSECARRHNHQF